MEWEHIAKSIIEDDQGKWDKVVAGEEMRITKSGALELTRDKWDSNNGGPTKRYSLSELATGQMCSRLGIPVPYYRRLSSEMKATAANYDLERLHGHSYLLCGKGEWIRGFLSAEYVTYNNSQIADAVHSLLNTVSVFVKAFVLEETHMFLKIISEDIADYSSGLKAGIMVGNSEVGLASISVEPFVFRKPCTNDLIVAKERAMRHPHIHLTVQELNRRLAIAIGDGFRVAATVLDTFLKTQEEPVADPLETIREIAQQRKLTQKFTDQAVSSYLNEPAYNRFAVINAFSSAALSLPSLERIEMERMAGSLLEANLS